MKVQSYECEVDPSHGDTYTRQAKPGNQGYELVSQVLPIYRPVLLLRCLSFGRVDFRVFKGLNIF
jgi:hypothetical protein